MKVRTAIGVLTLLAGSITSYAGERSHVEIRDDHRIVEVRHDEGFDRDDHRDRFVRDDERLVRDDHRDQFVRHDDAFRDRFGRVIVCDPR